MNLKSQIEAQQARIRRIQLVLADAESRLFSLTAKRVGCNHQFNKPLPFAEAVDATCDHCGMAEKYWLHYTATKHLR